jgi:dTDP-glucose 4,6-dehydratase
MLLVTGGAGFIGSNFVLQWIANKKSPLINLDKLTYAGNLSNLESLSKNPLHTFVRGDIGDRDLVRSLLRKHQPQAIINFAAETHVDRSIHTPTQFVQTNISSAFAFLDETYLYWKELPLHQREFFRFFNVSTDEVFGSLSPEDDPSNEESPFAPNSPYAASKASFDLLVRAYHQTFDFPTITTHASNNFGPYQFPEKLIPLILVNALQEKPLPIYGDGLQMRDWLYVEDHCSALDLLIEKGVPGQSYNICHGHSIANLELVKAICALLDELRPNSLRRPHASLIEFVKDRPGHDRRYALDGSKMRRLGWQPKEDLQTAMRKTVAWYLGHQKWLSALLSPGYKAWIASHYHE